MTGVNKLISQSTLLQITMKYIKYSKFLEDGLDLRCFTRHCMNIIVLFLYKFVSPNVIVEGKYSGHFNIN